LHSKRRENNSTCEVAILNGKYFKKSGHLVDRDVEGRKMVKGKPNKLNVMQWAGLIWLD
jgi:hypothetical protein